MSNSSCSKPPAEAGRGGASRSDHLIALGRITGVWGIKGWVKIYSHAREKERIFSYSPWYIGVTEQSAGPRKVADTRQHGGSLAVRLTGIDDRSMASRLVGQEIFVDPNQLPPLDPGEFYWFELEGLKVVNVDGIELGVVDHLLETGANDVLVVEGERQRLVPYTAHVVTRVDLGAGRMEVDWDADF